MKGRERSVVILGVAAIGLALLGRGYAELRHAVRDHRRQFEALALAARAQERTLDELPALEAALQRLRGEEGESLAVAYLQSRRESDAQAELAVLVRHWIQAERGALDASEAAVDSASDGTVESVGLRVAFTHDLQGALRTLRRIEERWPMVRVETVGLTALQPDAGEEVPEVLRVDLLLRGWYLASRPAERK